VGDLEVTPFEISHDVPTFGFLFRTGIGGMQRRLALATDLGRVGEGELPYFRDADGVVIEANYDERMLQQSPRHPVDKVRVSSAGPPVEHSERGDSAGRGGVLRSAPGWWCWPISPGSNEPRLAEETGAAPLRAWRRVPVLAAPAFEPGPGPGVCKRRPVLRNPARRQAPEAAKSMNSAGASTERPVFGREDQHRTGRRDSSGGSAAFGDRATLTKRYSSVKVRRTTAASRVTNRRTSTRCTASEAEVRLTDQVRHRVSPPGRTTSATGRPGRHQVGPVHRC
jgi:hypothetical protein